MMAATKKNANLLIELGCEELPPADLNKLATHFAKNFADALHAAEVIADAKNFTAFATPRRLAVLVKDVADKAPSRVVDARGPSVSAAFDANGKPTKAALGFAKSNGVAVGKLSTVKTDKGDYLSYSRKVTGKNLKDITTDALADVIRTLPVAKKMRWGDNDVEFVRPVHWLLALHGNKIVKTEALDIKANGFTYGHRFHAPAKLKITSADVYESTLSKKGMVVADFSKRRADIEKQLDTLAKKNGAKVVKDDALLDVVTGMVEYPRAVMGEFDKRFLKLPAEVLIACMRTHQKYFHLTSAKGKLLPAFITIANIKSKSDVHIKSGNERVVRARLSDAEFFYKSDLEVPLAERVKELENVTFHKKLGTMLDKTERVTSLAGSAVSRLHDNLPKGQETTLGKDVHKAAGLCKADLATDVVGEFPELQGVMGGAYARKDESKQVTDAIAQHYLPRYAGDQLPSTVAAQIIAVADRIDSLVGIFVAGEAPSGDRDPFALRRAALSVWRILVEKELDLDLYDLLNSALHTDSIISDKSDKIGKTEIINAVFNFVLERLPAYYQPLGYSISELNAVKISWNQREGYDAQAKPVDFDRRLKAVHKFFTKQREAAESLAAANKRIAGIMRNVDVTQLPTGYLASLFKHPTERGLVAKFDELRSSAEHCFGKGQYDDGLKILSKLKDPVDKFFDSVMVMDDDLEIRENRLALLFQVRALFLRVADISQMSTDQ